MNANCWKTQVDGNAFRICRLSDAPPSPEVLDEPAAVERYLRPKLVESVTYRPDVENFMVVCLNCRRRAIGFEIISTGTLDAVHVHPRDIFRTAFVMNAMSVVLVHNHPSGETSPSEADIKVTRDLIRAGQLLRLEVTDHLILGTPTPDSRGWASLRELGYFAC